VGDRKGSLATGKDADVVVLDADLRVVLTAVRGHIVYRRTAVDALSSAGGAL
jgi:N-acetylglucosamine-6-phosphate deacetylase